MKDITFYFAAGSKDQIELLRSCKVDAILVSYAMFRNGLPKKLADAAERKTIKVMLDSGAFTNWHKPGFVKFNDYLAFLKDYGKAVTEYITFDDINSKSKTLANYGQMREAGFNPLFVDHIRHPFKDDLKPRYASGSKLCWADVTLSRITRRSGVHTPTILKKRIEERLDITRSSPKTKVHLLAAGTTLGRYLPYMDVVDSLDSASWAINGGGFGKAFYVHFDEDGWPKMTWPHHSNAPKNILDRARAMGLNLHDRVDRMKWSVLQFKKYYAELIKRLHKANEANEPIEKTFSLDVDDVTSSRFHLPFGILHKAEDPRRGLRTPLPIFLLARLRRKEPAWILSAVDRSANVGEPLLLINEKLKPPDEIMGWGIVEMTEEIEFPSADAALKKLGPAVDEVSAREYATRNPKPTFAYKLKLVEAFKEPRDVEAAGRRIPNVKDEIDKAIWGSSGGKSKSAKWIVELLPEHKIYVEPFVGSGAVLLTKEPADVEVISDADKEIADAFRIVKNLKPEQLRALGRKNWKCARTTWKKIKESNPSDAVGKLHRFLYLARFSYGNMRGKSYDPGSEGLDGSTVLKRVEKNLDRLRKIRMYSGDFELVVRKYDSPSTVFFFDPPYAEYDTRLGENKFEEDRFFKILQSLKGKWLLTYGLRGELPKMLEGAGYKINTFTTYRSISAMRGVSDSKDLKQIWVTNYKATRKADDDIAFVATLAHDAVKKMDDKTFAATAERLADIWDNRFGDGPDEPDGLAREEILGAALIVMDVAAGRKVQLGDRYLFEAAAELTPAQKADLAPVHPGSEGEHEPIELVDAVEHVKPFILRRNAVSLVGSLPQWQTTRGDLDVLLKGPLDDGTRQAIEFRIGRMFPPEISKRLQFHNDDLGGPFTTHVPLLDLWAVPRTHDVAVRDGAEFQRIEMAELPVDKQDVYMLYPASPNRSVRSVFQLEFQKRSVHIDWRIAVRANQLIGWTLFAAKKGAIGSDVTALDQARALAAGLSLKGNRVLKPLQVTAGRGLQAVPKRPPPPVSWLDVDQRVWEEETKEGKTKHVMISVDRPMVGFGRIEPHFKEYFLTRGQRFNGTMFGRLTVGRGGAEEEEEAGRVTPEGETFWRFLVSAKPLPSILRRRSVRLKRMPPDGIAAIPRDLQALVPAEFRYWEKKGAEARKTRDALVESKFFTEDNVAVVGGRYVRVEERKKFYSVPPPIQKAGVVDGEYRLVWQTWKRRAETRRAGPSRQKWHLLARAGGKKYGWTFEQNPIVTKRAAGVSGAHTDGDWKREGEIEPGTTDGMIENDTKATPSHATVSESGKVQVLTEAGLEKGSLLLRLETSDGAKMVFVKPEEEGSRQWVSELRSAKAVELSDMRENGIVAFASTGPEAVVCECGGDEFDRVGDLVRCGSCHAAVDVRHRASYAWELKANGADIGPVPVVEVSAADVPTRDGVQIWDPDKVDDRLDRKQLRPPALFAPMKPRDGNKFNDVGELVDAWKKSGAGRVLVEPKLNGRVLVGQGHGDGETLIYFEDSMKDKSHVLPSVAKDLAGAKGGPFAFVSELLDFDDEGNVLPRRTLARFGQDTPQDDKNVRLIAFRTVYAGGKNLTAEREDDQYAALKRWVKASGVKRVDVVPRREARTEAELREAIKWSAKQPGSEGAAVKDGAATYSLGGSTSSWWMLKLARSVRVIVLAKTRKKPAPQQRAPSRTWVYTAGVGPVGKDDVDKWKETGEHGGKTYVVVGKTGATNVQASVGDTIEVDVLELLVNREAPRTIHWFGPPMAQDKVSGAPMTTREIESVARPDEIEREKEGGERTIKSAHMVPIRKGEKFEGYFKDVVLKPNDGVDGPIEPDTQDDVYSAAAIDHAMRWNARHGKQDNIQHGELGAATGDWGFIVVQNYLADVDFWLGPNGEAVKEPNDWRDGLLESPGEGFHFVPKGAWIREGFATGEKLKSALESGEIGAWSIEGFATKVPEMIDLPGRRAA